MHEGMVQRSRLTICLMICRYELLESMPPFMGGGEMIQDVYLDHVTFALPPSRFEAGTPAIGEAIALGAACDYLDGLGMDNLHAYEMELGRHLYSKVSHFPGHCCLCGVIETQQKSF